MIFVYVVHIIEEQIKDEDNAPQTEAKKLREPAKMLLIDVSWK